MSSTVKSAFIYPAVEEELKKRMEQPAEEVLGDSEGHIIIECEQTMSDGDEGLGMSISIFARLTRINQLMIVDRLMEEFNFGPMEDMVLMKTRAQRFQNQEGMPIFSDFGNLQ